jgi:flavin reductase (DIM6/NTAB) family NADH-FMN oxidoreductase RutF/NAD(P)H-dependent FMN reductase
MRPNGAVGVSPDTFKGAFSRLAAGVAVIGFERDGRYHGFTATSLTPVSVEPPIALFCVGNSNDSHPHLKHHTPVGISILSKAQSDLSSRFSAKVAADRYAGVPTIERTPGIPLLSGAVACLEATITDVIPTGDHTIYLCQVNWAQTDQGGSPLLYYSREYCQLRSLSPPDAEGRPQSKGSTGSLVAVIASAAPSVRTAAAIHYICRRAREMAPGLQTDIVNLNEARLPLCDGRKITDVVSVDKVVKTISAASVVVLATPIYRGTYSAALKNLLDWLPLESLEGKRVGLIASGTTPHHYLMIDMTLRPLLAWFNAVLIPGSVYLTRDDISHDGLPSETTAANLNALARALVTDIPRVGAAGPPALIRQLSLRLADRAAQSPLSAKPTAGARKSRWFSRLTRRSVRG